MENNKIFGIYGFVEKRYLDQFVYTIEDGDVTCVEIEYNLVFTYQNLETSN